MTVVGQPPSHVKTDESSSADDSYFVRHVVILFRWGFF
jgi:hypothetical protein